MNKIAEIELKRIANILVYFANSTECFGVTKANKLLYYLDCFHLLRYGRTVIKDKYIKNQLGPVPTETYNRLMVIREFNCFPESDRQKFNLEYELLFQYITIDSGKISPRLTFDQIVPRKEFEPIWFSKSEIEIMEELAKEHKNTSASELVAKTHNESPYKEAEMFGFMDLKLFLKDHNMPQNEIDHIAYREREIEAIALNYQGY